MILVGTSNRNQAWRIPCHRNRWSPCICHTAIVGARHVGKEMHSRKAHEPDTFPENCDPKHTGSCGPCLRSTLLCNAMRRVRLKASASCSMVPSLPSHKMPSMMGSDSLSRSIRTYLSTARWRLTEKGMTFLGLKEEDLSIITDPDCKGEAFMERAILIRC